MISSTVMSIPSSVAFKFKSSTEYANMNENDSSELFRNFSVEQTKENEINLNFSTIRNGIITYCEDLNDLLNKYDDIYNHFSQLESINPSSCPVNALHLIIKCCTLDASGCPPVEIENFIKSKRDDFFIIKIRRISITIPTDPNGDRITPYIFTFSFQNSEYIEDQNIRNIEAPLTLNLELSRLRHFKIKLIPTPSQTVHIYEGTYQVKTLLYKG